MYVWVWVWVWVLVLVWVLVWVWVLVLVCGWLPWGVGVKTDLPRPGCTYILNRVYIQHIPIQ